MNSEIIHFVVSATNQPIPQLQINRSQVNIEKFQPIKLMKRKLKIK